VLRRGDVCIAVSTGGAAPGIAAGLRDRIEAALASELDEAAATIDEHADVDEKTGRRRLRPRDSAASSPGGGDSPTGQAVDVVFQSFNRYLGVGVGEHLGYALTGVWSIFAGAAIIGSTALPAWLIAVGIGLLV